MTGRCISPSAGAARGPSFSASATPAANRPPPPILHDADGSQARELRHKLEAFHGRVDSAAVETAWPQLDSPDRYIRYAARIAIEAQPVETWKAKALAETKPQASLTALLAVARLGGKESQSDLLKSLGRISTASLSEDQQLEKLRVLEVSISRQGKPSPEEATAIAADLDPLYPAKSVFLNRELCQVLLAIDAPGAVAKTMALLGSRSDPGRAAQLHPCPSHDQGRLDR